MKKILFWALCAFLFGLAGILIGKHPACESSLTLYAIHGLCYFGVAVSCAHVVGALSDRHVNRHWHIH